MKYLFITGLYPTQLRSLFRDNCKKVGLQEAPDAYQWALIDGLIKNNADFFTISYPFLPYFPFRYSKFMVEGGPINLTREIGKSIPYPNIPFVRELYIEYSVEKNVEMWIEKYHLSQEKFCVLTYTPEPSFIRPLVRLKDKYPQMIISTVITDLVDNLFSFAGNRLWYKRIQCNQLIKNTKVLYKWIDKYILISKHMVEKIPAASDRYCVIEGIYNNSETSIIYERLEKSIMYTGVLEEYAGVRLMIEAFLSVKDSEARLIVCGFGPLTEYVEEMSRKDKRIIFKGNIPRKDALLLQKSVSFLINPRLPNGDITKYSFPSKTMEYMSSGTPMIGYHLEGMPSDYYSFMYTPDDFSVNALSNLYEYLLNSDYKVISGKGRDAKEYILKNKTSVQQVRKILTFLNN